MHMHYCPPIHITAREKTTPSEVPTLFPFAQKAFFLLNFLTQKTNNWYFNAIHNMGCLYSNPYLCVYNTRTHYSKWIGFFYVAFCYDFGLSYFNLFLFFLNPYDIVFVMRHYSTFVMSIYRRGIVKFVITLVCF